MTLNILWHSNIWSVNTLSNSTTCILLVHDWWVVVVGTYHPLLIKGNGRCLLPAVNWGWLSLSSLVGVRWSSSVGSCHCHPYVLVICGWGIDVCGWVVVVIWGCLLFMGSVRRSSSLDWKKDRNRTEPNCKRPDHRLRLHKFWIFPVASCDVCRKIEKPKKTGLDRLQPVFRPVTRWTLLTYIFP